MKQKINKAVFPVAGLGTRFLPATKANPKEMLPILDKPLIQYAVEEAISAGITQLIFVTSSSKRAIEDHFDTNYELESKLEQRGEYQRLSQVKGIIPEGVSCVYIRQANALGLGHAVSCARDVIGDEPFAVLLADDLIASEGKPCLSSMVEHYQQHGNNVIAVQKVPLGEVEKYGIVSLKEANSSAINDIVEKPKQHQAPSQLAAIGRYILNPSIFYYLETLAPGRGNEIQLTDAIAQLLKTETVESFVLQGKRFDCGSRMGYLEATLTCALQQPDMRDRVKQYLHTLLEETVCE